MTPVSTEKSTQLVKFLDDMRDYGEQIIKQRGNRQYFKEIFNREIKEHINSFNTLYALGLDYEEHKIR